jgi:hypothetical protein
VLEYDPAKFTIYELSRNKNLVGVKSMLLQGVDVNTGCSSKRYTALIASVYNRDLELLELLLR